MLKKFPFQTILFSISTLFSFIEKQSVSNISVVHKYTVAMSKTVLFRTIQLSVNTQFSSILSIDRTLSGAATPGQSGPGSGDNEGVLRIPQSSSITDTSPSDCLMSYIQDTRWVGVLLPCTEAIGVFYSPSGLGKTQDH